MSRYLSVKMISRGHARAAGLPIRSPPAVGGLAGFQPVPLSPVGSIADMRESEPAAEPQAADGALEPAQKPSVAADAT